VLGASVLSVALLGIVVADNQPSAPTVFIERGSEFEYVVVRAPLPTEQLGVIAVAAVDAAASGGQKTTLPDVRGAEPAADPPTGWPLELPSAERGDAPFGTSEGRRKCKCSTVIGDTDRERIAVLYARREFVVGKEAGKQRMLSLRAHYHDGLVAYINGKEVARRNVGRDRDPMSTAHRLRGPEWETFAIPVTAGLLVEGKNILSIEVRPSGYLLAPSLDIELVGGGATRIIRGPLLQRVGTDEATIVFDTNLPSRGTVEYGHEPELGKSIASADGSLSTHHTVLLRGLSPNKKVHYRVAVDGDVSPTSSFHLAPAAGKPIRFAVYGDMRGGHRIHGKIVEAIVSEAPDFVIVTGDLVLRGSDLADWQRFFEVAAPLLMRVPYYPVAGNHDMGRAGDERRRMNEIFELWPGPKDRPPWGHWYSFDVADVHFVMLDSNSYRHDLQLEWLKADLAAANKSGVRAIFAAVHDGPYSRALHRGNLYAAEHYAPVLAKHGVTLVFSGHDHHYQRGEVDGLGYIVSGGGGAPLYSVRCGVRGKRRCKVDDGMKHVAKEHHYVMIEVFRDFARVCPKRPDKTPLEKCIKMRFPRRKRR